jgi:hypothetical protein
MDKNLKLGPTTETETAETVTTETAKTKTARTAKTAKTEKTETVAASTPPDPFTDLSQIRLDQSFADSCGVKKLVTTIPVRKPLPQDFVRVHPDPTYRGNFPIIDLKSEREIYVVTKQMAAALVGECVPVILFTAINRQGVVFIWPVRLPGYDGKTSTWHQSANEAAERAMNNWVRVKANMSLGAYDIFEAEASLQEPEWPNMPFNELLRVAFKDRLVDRIDHPVIKRFRGLS